MLETIPTAYLLAILCYLVAFIGYALFMRREKTATWPRAIIAATVWPLIGLLALLYVGERH